MNPRLTSDNRKMPQLGIFPNPNSLRYLGLRLSQTLGEINITALNTNQS